MICACQPPEATYWVAARVRDRVGIGDWLRVGREGLGLGLGSGLGIGLGAGLGLGLALGLGPGQG